MPGGLANGMDAHLNLYMSKVLDMRKGIGQHSIIVFGRDRNGFSPLSQLPFVLSLHKAMAHNGVEAVIFMKSVPNRVSKDFLGAHADKLQLTSKGATLAYEGEVLEYHILKVTKAIKFLQFYWQLNFVASQSEKDEVEDNRPLYTCRRTVL